MSEEGGTDEGKSEGTGGENGAGGGAAAQGALLQRSGEGGDNAAAAGTEGQAGKAGEGGGEATQGDRPAWLTDDRYWNSETGQVETEKLFGSFQWAASKLGDQAGAPEVDKETGKPTYKLNIPEGISGGEDLLTVDDPLFERAAEMAQSMNMTQEGLDKWVSMFLEQSARDNEIGHDETIKDIRQAGWTEERTTQLADYFFTQCDGNPELFSKFQQVCGTQEALEIFDHLRNKGLASIIIPNTGDTAGVGTITEESWKARYDDPRNSGSTAADHAFQAETERQAGVVNELKKRV